MKRAALALACGLLAFGPTAPATVPAAATPLGGSTATATQAADERARITVLQADSSGALGADIRVEVEITNISDTALDDLQVTTRRGDALASTADAAIELEQGDFPYFGTFARANSLEPGESARLTLTVPTGLGAEGTLAIEESGAYPLMFSLTGTQDGDPVALADARLILHFGELPKDVGDHSLTVVYPITEHVDIVPGETGGEPLIMQSEDLAAALAAGGRLDRLLTTYTDHDLRGAGCVAVDPALVDTVDRMAEGYTVSATRPSTAQKPQRLRDSWFSDDDDDRGVEGTGSADARAWLDRLANVDCLMVMPWANTDVNAVLKAHNGFLVHEAVSRGAETIETILGRSLNSSLLAVGSPGVSAQLPTSVLIADGTPQHGDSATYDPALAELLSSRFNAAAGLDLALSAAVPQQPESSADHEDQEDTDDPASTNSTDSTSGTGSAAASAVVAKLPNYQDPDAAQAALEEAERLLATAHPGTLTTHPAAANTAANTAATGASAATLQDDAPSPAFTDPEILQVEQQAHYTDELMNIMVNDHNIALTRYGFTLPLRRDLLAALSLNPRPDGTTTIDTARLQANSTQLQDLRNSVSLIPPGNVYTRASESSPLLIVAENGLPLPVDARILYEADQKSNAQGATLNTPNSVHIPAKGSITVSMTADLPDDSRRDIRLWLATPSGATISQPVFISVQTRGGMLGVYGLGAIAGLLVLGAVALRIRRTKKTQEVEAKKNS
ncbi:hypothetical protein [uncultured Corynebacterium sp.]|uniref:hypothetical protein n=1 Tax=uncultured Corynebacterium sp. TaxID=159447 RepID=UPI0025D11034|nr:hypothetical protein [uncultured Corynebacterium sp.]